MESKLDYGGGGGGATPTTTTAASTTQFLTSKYIRNSRAVGLLWGVFTVCAAILMVVVFVSEHWMGDTEQSKGPGHFGLWRFCTVLATQGQTLSQGRVVCVGDLNSFSSILSPAFRAATVFVGLAVIIMLLCICAFLLFCFVKSNNVFEICGTMQFLAGICLAIGILAFPAGWDNEHVRGICGPSADDFRLGDCGIRWAFVLAVIAFLDCWILGFLAFTLARRVVRPAPPMSPHPHMVAPPESHYMNPQSIYKGEINSGFIGDTQSLTGSRKSLNLQPVMMMPHPPPPPPPHHPADDGYSEFGQRGPGGGPSRSNPNSPYVRHPYPPPQQQQPGMHNFQL